MKKSKKHLWVVLCEIVGLVVAAGILACLIFMLVKLGDPAAATNPSQWRYHFAQWVYAIQGLESVNKNALLIGAIGDGVGLVLAILTLVFGIRARKFVSIWYFFEMGILGTAAGYGASVIGALSEIKNLQLDPTVHAPLGCMFVGGIVAFVLLVIQFVLFMLECHEARANRPVAAPVAAPKEEAKSVEEKKEEATKAEEAPKAAVMSEPAEEPKVEEKKEEPKVEEKAEEPKSEEAPKEEAKPVEEKPAEKKAPVKKAPAKKPAEKKEPAKKEEKKPEEKKAAAPAKKAEEKKPAEKKAPAKKANEEKKSSGKVYHISQHPTEDKWQVKLAKGEKALKLFDTQAEAIAYAKEVAGNQEGSIRVHSREGKIRKA